MKLRLVLAGLVASIAASAIGGQAAAAPALQLPWPTGVEHRINGGDTYGCGYHTGSSYYAIDFQLATGDDVSAVAAGTVSARDNVGDIRGNFIEIDHGGGYRTRYLHLHDWAAGTDPGMPVAQGQVIGHAGGSGHVAPHLHFDMKLNGAAYKAEPMSGVPGPGEHGFGWYGFSVESGLGCYNNGHDPSPYWTSQPARNSDVATFYDYGSGAARIHTWLSDGSRLNWNSPDDPNKPQLGWWRTASGYDLSRVGDRMVRGDFNGDGRNDVATFYDYGSGAARIHVWLSDGVRFNWNSPDDPNNPQLGWWSTASGYDLSQVGNRFVSGDFNNDGKHDVATFYNYG